jgi:predicted nucleic acid-binding protein
MSLADAFGLALAERLGYAFVTSDHKELDPVAASGDVRITFIR